MRGKLAKEIRREYRQVVKQADPPMTGFALMDTGRKFKVKITKPDLSEDFQLVPMLLAVNEYSRNYRNFKRFKLNQRRNK